MDINSLSFTSFSPMEKINNLSDIKNGMFNEYSNGFQVTNSDFRDVFTEAVNNVRVTDAELAHEQYKFATGQSEDTHSLSIAATKAQISVELLTAIRDKSLESYNELIKTGI